MTPEAKAKIQYIVKELLIAVTGGAFVLGVFLLVQSGYGRVHAERKVTPLGLGDAVQKLPSSEKGYLLIATSEKCRYSQASVPFHQDLVHAALSHGLRVLMLVPDDASASFARSTFPQIGNAIRTADLRSWGIVGTPFVALLSPQNRIEHLWSGKIPVHSQVIVLSQISSPLDVVSRPDFSEIFLATDDQKTAASLPGVSPDANTGQIVGEFTGAALQDFLQQKRLLDLSTREEFALNGRSGAVNIPVDELGVRGPIELDKNSSWVLDCSRVKAGDCDIGAFELEKQAFTSVMILNRGAEGLDCQVTSTK